jgi:MYXO-CTERM domain-containing protein
VSLVAIAAVLSTVHLEGDVTADNGDYVDVPFTVPVGTVEIQVTHTDGSSSVILDWGVWGPDGYRGWAGGLVDDAIIGVDQSSRSYLPGPITPGTWTVSVGKAHLDPAGGHYSIDVTCRDNATLAVLPKAPFAAVVLSPDRRWYKGDFHVHSIQSGDADATFDQISTLATSRGLDFVNVSDHNTVAQHALLAAIQPSSPAFLFLRGAEITTYTGHGNAVGLHDYVEHRLGYAGRTVQGIADDVAAQGAVFIVNHPMLDLGSVCIGCEWKHVDDTPWGEVAGLEIITGNFDIGVQAFVPRVIALWDSLLDQGYRIAAIGGSDDHNAGRSTGPTASQIASPTTLVLADGLSEAAIIDGIRHGRTIVQLRGPDDPLVELTAVAAEGGVAGEIGAGGVAELGDDLTASRVKLIVRVTSGAGTFVQLWRDGKKLTQVMAPTDDFTHTFEDTPPASGGGSIGGPPTRYRVELIDDTNQRIVVTSHIYVHGVAAPGGCGCHSGGSSGGIAVGLALLFARRRRR